MARLLLLDVIDGTGLQEVECKSLDDYYKALQCDCFDIANRSIDGKRFDIFVDDVGLFVDNPIPSVLDKDMKPMLVGNVIFANHNMAGDTTSLSDEDIALIKKHAITVMNFDANPIKEWIAITSVDY